MTTDDSIRARWRRPRVEGTGHYRYGYLLEVNKNVATIVDNKSHGLHSIEVQFVEVQQSGPRGGKHWVKLEEEG